MELFRKEQAVFFFTALLSFGSFAQESNAPAGRGEQDAGGGPLIDGSVNPELVADHIAIEAFATLVRSYGARDDLDANLFINSFLETSDRDFSDLIAFLSQHFEYREAVSKDDLRQVCADAVEGAYASSSELIRKLSVAEERTELEIRDQLTNGIAEILGNELNEVFLAAIDNKLKTTIRIRAEVNYSDFSDEDLDKVDMDYVLASFCSAQ